MHRMQTHNQEVTGPSDSGSRLSPPSLVVRTIEHPIAGGWYERYGKRWFDLVFATSVLFVLAPLMTVLWCVLRINLGRDVVITQDRVGLNGQTFGMFKFRTMRWSRRASEAPFEGADRRIAHKVDHDPRHTRVGRTLRKLSLDELPQLANVLLGSMSVVGPRPELASVVDRIDQRGHIRHSVRPGMTGEWQVSGRQTGTPLHESFESDVPYLSRVTLRNDLSIIVRTVSVVLQRGGR